LCVARYLPVSQVATAFEAVAASYVVAAQSTPSLPTFPVLKMWHRYLASVLETEKEGKK
jgi:hypothetical protein